MSTDFTVDSSKTSPGMFSDRYASPTSGSSGVMIPGGPSLPASHAPSMSAMCPSSA
jgi:hypothetical protein